MILAVQLRSRRQMKLRGKKFCNESNETQKRGPNCNAIIAMSSDLGLIGRNLRG